MPSFCYQAKGIREFKCEVVVNGVQCSDSPSSCKEMFIEILNINDIEPKFEGKYDQRISFEEVKKFSNT